MTFHANKPKLCGVCAVCGVWWYPLDGCEERQLYSYNQCGQYMSVEVAWFPNYGYIVAGIY